MENNSLILFKRNDVIKLANTLKEKKKLSLDQEKLLYKWGYIYYNLNDDVVNAVRRLRESDEYNPKHDKELITILNHQYCRCLLKKEKKWYWKWFKPYVVCNYFTYQWYGIERDYDENHTCDQDLHHAELYIISFLNRHYGSKKFIKLSQETEEEEDEEKPKRKRKQEQEEEQEEEEKEEEKPKKWYNKILMRGGTRRKPMTEFKKRDIMRISKKIRERKQLTYKDLTFLIEYEHYIQQMPKKIDHIVKKIHENKRLYANDVKYLDTALHGKKCRCVLTVKKKNINPIALCNHSVYNVRGLNKTNTENINRPCDDGLHRAELSILKRHRNKSITKYKTNKTIGWNH